MLQSIRILLLALALTLPALAIFQDEAYEKDWHISLLGEPLKSSTFFHQPQPESKATLIYTLTKQNVLGAINPKDGEVVWRQSIVGNGRGVAKKGIGRVVVGLGDTVSTWNAVDGKQIWANTFAQRVVDIRVRENQNVIVLTEDGTVRTLDKSNGEVISEWNEAEPSDTPHSIISSFGRLTVLSVTKGKELAATIFHSEEKIDRGVFVGTHIENPEEEIVYSSQNSGVVFWTERNKQSLKFAILVAQDSAALAKFDHPLKAITVQEVSPMEYIVHYQDEEEAWVESYKVDTNAGLKKRLMLQKKLGKSYIAVGAPPTINEKVPFAWVQHTGDIEVYNTEDLNPLATIPVNGTGIAGVDFAIAEVRTRADGSFATRAFTVSAKNGNTILLRNGEVAWTRLESLAGSKASTWVELLDAKTEEIKEEIKLESQQTALLAWLHRVKRHANELRVYGPNWLKKLPSRFIKNLYSANVIDDGPSDPRYRDAFGYRKLLVLVTARGRLVAIDVGQKGKIVWEGGDANSFDANTNIAGIYEIGKGVITVIAEDGRYYIVGIFEGRTRVHTFDGNVKGTTAITQGGEQSVIVFLEKGGTLTANILPQGELKEPVYFSFVTADNTLQGVRISGEGDIDETWSFTPPDEHRIISVESRPAHDPVASIGRVMADRSVMYKYLNNHALFVGTVSERESTLSIYLLDSVSGSVLHSATHHSVDVSKPVNALLSENWLVYSFFADDELLPNGATGPKGYQLVSVELYESAIKNDRGKLGDSDKTSSLDKKLDAGTPHVESRAYIFPSAISAIGTTVTLQGITTHDVLFYLSPSKALLSLPRRLLSATRPIDRNPDESEREEGLAKYSPVIPADPQAFLTHERILVSKKAKILTTPSMLESTSTVVLLGDADIFGTRVSPSMEFDVLGKGFNKFQLIATVVAVAVGVAFLKPMVNKKTVERKWRS